MMNEEQKNIYAFGFGLALLIPFMLTFRVLHKTYGMSNTFVFILSFIALLFVISKVASWEPVTNLWIGFVLAGVLWLKIKTGVSAPASVLWGLAVVSWLISLLHVAWIQPLYDLWMPVARSIGYVISFLFLAIVFYLVFAPVGIVLRIMGKDLLHEKLEPEKESYWISKNQDSLEKDRYTKQF